MSRLATHAVPGILALWGAIALLCVLPASAGADVFGPISLVSQGTLGAGAPQQAEYAHDAAISGNGQYVAFDGSVGGATGVWRRDLATGAIEQVAGGDAELPSISEDGRYISFTSSEDLVPEDEAHGVNVWVRDMDPGPGEPEYILASAVNHSSKGLTYAYGASPPSSEELEYGAVAAGRSAISASGQEVAFVTTIVSDLVLSRAEADGEEPVHVKTPAFQVAVRDIPARETTLVSGEYEPLTGETTDRPVSAEAGGGGLIGAVYPGKKSSFGPVPANGGWLHGPPGASISADGSTVAWMGENIGKQARMLPGQSPSPLYTEPLWRRIAPGSHTPTERVTGGSDPGNPACVASGGSGPACEGPFKVILNPFEAGKTAGIWSEAGLGDAGQGDPVPRLSETGEEVAFISTALPVAIGAGFGTEEAGEPADLYVVDMRAGLTRDQAITSLTRIGGANEAADEPITDFDISPNGDQVAFTTARIEFPLGSPAYVSEREAEAGESELFDVDLGNDTLTRVSHGYDGGPSEQPHPSKVAIGAHDPYEHGLFPPTAGAQSPSFSSNGGLLAFSSTASNLVYGDGNTPAGTSVPTTLPDGSDAFVVGREEFDSLPTPQDISPAPEPSSQPSWQLGVSALSRANGSVLLYVEVPGAGTLRASARGSVLVKSSVGAATRRHAGRESRKGRARETVATRTVATSSKLAHASDGEVVALVLTLAKPYAALAAHGGGLSASVGLTFAAPGHPTLRDSLPITFLRNTKSRPSKARRSEAGVHSSNSHGHSSKADSRS